MEGQIIMYLILGVIGILLYVALIRWVFLIDKQIENQGKTINLLAHLLKINGVSQEDINTLVGKKKK